MNDSVDTVLFLEFEFERPIQLYVKPVLVGVTLIVNVLVILVFGQKSFRNNTTVLFIAIAVSDSLTGLVVLPSSLSVFKDLFPKSNHTFPNASNLIAIIISNSLCEAYSISTMYLTMIFQSISFWFTTYLCIQRYVSVKYPFKKHLLFTKRNNIIVSVAIVLFAVIIHNFHLVRKKTAYGYCTWIIEEPCFESCAYFIVNLVLHHLIPCVVLTTTTVLLVRQLHVNTTSAIRRGQNANSRQVTQIVIAIALVFLIQEIPIGILALFSIIVGLFYTPPVTTVKALFLILYITEFAMYLSFTANFVIYTIWNKRFRVALQTLLWRKRPNCVCGNASSKQADQTRTTGVPTGNEIDLRTFNEQ